MWTRGEVNDTETPHAVALCRFVGDLKGDGDIRLVRISGAMRVVYPVLVRY